jgi:hypothetical protein
VSGRYEDDSAEPQTLTGLQDSPLDSLGAHDFETVAPYGNMSNKHVKSYRGFVALQFK